MPRGPGGTGNGVYLLLLINFGLFFINWLAHPRWMALLPLNHWAPRWWQFVTATFVHANWEHLSSNAFSLLIFGRIGAGAGGAGRADPLRSSLPPPLLLHTLFEPVAYWALWQAS